MPHPDFDCPENHEAREPLPRLRRISISRARLIALERTLTAAPPAAAPANRPANAAVGSPSLTDETHGPAR